MSASFWTHRSPAAFRRAHLPPAQQLPQVANRQLVQLRERLQVVLIGLRPPGETRRSVILRRGPFPSRRTTSFDADRAAAISERLCVKMPVSQVQTPELILEPLFIEAGSYGNLGAFASGGRGRRSWGAWTRGALRWRAVRVDEKEFAFSNRNSHSYMLTCYHDGYRIS